MLSHTPKKDFCVPMPVSRSWWPHLSRQPTQTWSVDGVDTSGNVERGDSAGEPGLVQLQAMAFRCPYCGSAETHLENLFGPTPYRSIRCCDACRQPFEQFKTI